MRAKLTTGVRGEAWPPSPFVRGLRRACCWLLAFTMAALCVPAAALPRGDPPVVRLVPDIEVEQQNFAIAQDADSIVYIGNSRGLLCFDGERWQLVRLPNGDLVRSLAFDGRSRVYVGGYNVFGYVDRNDAGVVAFHDLTPRFAALLGQEPFADIWHITVTAQGVFFGAVGHLFLYRPDGGEVRLWRAPGRFGALAVSASDIVVQFRGEGLRRYQNGNWMPLPGSSALSLLISEWIPLPDGGLLSLAADGHWHEWIDGQLRDYPMPAGSPPSSQFTAGLPLADGSIAFSADDGSLRVFDPRQQAWHTLGIDSGWLSGLIADRGGGLLTIGNQALFHIGWPGPWTVIGRSAGISGLVHDLRRWSDRWYALSESGAFIDEPATPQRPGPSFRALDWTDHEAWDLLPIDAHLALFAESYQLKLIDGNAVRTIEDHRDLYPRRLLQSRFDPSLVYVGTEFGVALVQGQAAGWQLKLDRGSRASGVTSLAETAANEIWYGSEREGIHRVRIAADHTRLVEDRAFGTADGMIYDKVAEAAISLGADGNLVASTNAGLFRWNGSRFEPEAMAGLAGLRRDGELLRLTDDGRGNQWAYSPRHIYHRRSGQGWIAEEAGDVIDGSIASMAFDGDGAALFNCTGSILRYDDAQAPDGGPAASLRLSSVQRIDEGGQQAPLPLHPAGIPRFVRDGFGLEFRFALADFRSRQGTRYQARLIGHDDRYSDWSHATRYLYRHLEAGDYVFIARARDSLGRISELPPYRFSVLPPWYASGWARALWVALLIGVAAGLSYAGFSARLRLLRASKRELEQVVAERTRALEAANRRLEELAHIDDLTSIANRRGLESWLRQAWQRCAEHARPMALMIIDVDHFRDYNDCHGHLAGDELLKRIVRELSNCLRRSEDMVGRYGGDEFVAVLPGADAKATHEVAEAMRQRLRASSLGTISVGIVARQPHPDEEVSQLLREADAALYESKRRGRDCISIYGAAVASAEAIDAVAGAVDPPAGR